MSKQNKLLARFLSIPADLTWDELVRILSYYGYEEYSKGKTAGSRKKFADSHKQVILLHKPHPANIVKKYAVKQVIEHLKEQGKITNE